MLVYKGSGSILAPLNPEILSIINLQDSKYLYLKKITYLESNIEKTWDIVNAHDSVAILLYDKEMEGFIFIRQLRINVFNMHKKSIMYELCAGLIDKDLSEQEIAIQEVEEECGYVIRDLEKINTFYSSANGSKQVLFLAYVNDRDKINVGGGNESEGEKIECVFVPKDRALEFLNDEHCPKNQALSYAVLWFLFQKDFKGKR